MDLSKLEQEITKFISKTPKSKSLQERASRFMPGGSSRGTAYYDPYPAFFDRGQGNHIFDVDGNKYLDYMINAIRAARAFTGRHKIAKFEGGYHGSHEYVSVSVRPPSWKLDPNGPTSIPEFPGQPQSVSREVIVMPYNDLAKSEELLRKYKSDISGVIMEPVASALGYLPGDIEFLKGIRELTLELGIILIYDEVQSFRIGPGGAQVEWNINPDITALGGKFPSTSL